MFKSLFSFNGRIRRTEYGLSFIIYIVIYTMILSSVDKEASLVFLLFIPLIWFLWSQGAKRCHDIGKSGWWQIIPFYFFWMLFEDGRIWPNQYGDNPKHPNLNAKDDYKRSFDDYKDLQ